MAPPPYPFRVRGAGTDGELLEWCANELRQAILLEAAETVSAVIPEPILSSGDASASMKRSTRFGLVDETRGRPSG